MFEALDVGQLLYDGVEDAGGGSGAKFISESVVVPANPGVSYSSVGVTFPEPFDAIPNITMTVQSGSAVYAEAESTTATGFTCVVRSTSALTRDAGDVSDRAIDRDYSVWYQATDDSTISRFGGSGGGGDAGPHDHDYLPLEGGTLTGDLTVDGDIHGSNIRLGSDGQKIWGSTNGTNYLKMVVADEWRIEVQPTKVAIKNDLLVKGDLQVDGAFQVPNARTDSSTNAPNLYVNTSGTVKHTTFQAAPKTFNIADGIDTRDVLDRAETATMPAPDAEGVATADVEAESLTVNEVVTALLAKVKEQSEQIAILSADIQELKGN
jgi:hypothetical protein